MNKNDLLYYAINNYYAIQTMNSFCKEAIKGTDIQDSQKRLLDMYSNLIPLFNIETEHIEDLCDKLTLISQRRASCVA